jgi:hypothetical protein
MYLSDRLSRKVFSKEGKDRLVTLIVLFCYGKEGTGGHVINRGNMVYVYYVIK